MDLDRLTDTILSQLFIELEASGRHVHVTREQAMALFGHALTPERPLSQPGQFLSRERVTVKGPKGEFQNVAVLGPERKAGQVEISLTDCRQLGLSAPVRLSGDIGGTPGALLLGPRGTVQLREGVIVARRHVHLTPEAAERFGSISFMVNSFRLHYAARCFFTMPLPIAAPMNAATITPATSATDTQDCSIWDAARMVS